MRIFVAGASGAIGPRLAPRLADAWQPRYSTWRDGFVQEIRSQRNAG